MPKYEYPIVVAWEIGGHESGWQLSYQLLAGEEGLRGDRSIRPANFVFMIEQERGCQSSGFMEVYMHLLSSLNCNGILRKSDGTIPAKAAAYRVSVREYVVTDRVYIART